MKARTLLSAVVALAAALVLPTPLVATPAPIGDLRARTLAWHADLTASTDINRPGHLIYNGGAHQTSCDAAVLARLHLWYPGGDYAARSRARLAVLLATLPRFLQGYRSDAEQEPSASPGTIDFFIPYPLVLAARWLEEAGELPPPLRAELEAFAYAWFTPVTAPGAHPDELNNTAFTRAVGYRLAAEFFASGANTADRALRRAAWLDYAQAVWGRFVALGDVTENATVYTTISAAYAWLLGDLQGDTTRFQQTSVRAMLERMRDEVSPAGQLALYGDSFNAGESDEWAVRADWTYAHYAFTRAAAAYGDPSFRWAGDLIGASGAFREPLNDNHRRMFPLLFLALADGVAGPAPSPAPPPLASKLQTRRTSTASGVITEVPDKLILASSRKPGTTFAVFDLFPPRGWHSHINQGGALAYLQAGNVPLLTSLDGNLRGAEDSNLLLIRRGGESFPRRIPDFSPGIWYRSEFPLRNVRSLGPGHLRRLERLTLRVAVEAAEGNTPRRASITVDNLRLFGAASGLTIDNFDQLQGWALPDNTEATIVPGAEGGVALRLDFTNTTRAIRVFFVSRVFQALEVNLDENPFLGLDWRGDGALDATRPFILRVDRTSTGASGASSFQTDFHGQSTQLGARLADALQSSLADYHLGVLNHEQWFTAGTRARRYTLLDPHGAILVRDDILPDAAAVGRSAGPVWNLGPTAEPEVGGQWTASRGASTNLFIWQKPAPGRTTGVQTFRQGDSRPNQRVVFARQALSAGRPERFVSVLIPHRASESGRILAERLALQDSPEGDTGRTELAYRVGGETRRAFLDVLHADGADSLIEFGDPRALAGFVARSPRRTRQITPSIDTDAAELSLEHRFTAAGRDPLRFSARAIQNLQLGGRTLLEASAPVDVLQLLFHDRDTLLGRVTAPAAATLSLPAASPFSGARVDDIAVASAHSASDETVTFSLPAGGERRIVVADRHLVLRWPLIDRSAPLVDDLAGPREGALLNGPAWVDDAERAQALNLDGVDDLVRYDGDTVTGYPFTFSAWIKTTRGTQMTVASLLSGASSNAVFDIGIRFGRARIIACNTTVLEVSGTRVVNDGAWHHLAAVFTGPEQRALYVDGVLDGADTTRVNFPDGVNRFSLGCYDRPTPANFYAGRISDARLYSRALAPSEIKALATPPASPAPLSAFAAWQARQMPRGASALEPTADDDGDGLANLLEFALGRHPSLAEPASPFLPEADGGFLRLLYPRAKLGAVDHVFTGQSASDPGGPWSAADVNTQIVTDDGLTQTLRLSTPLGPSGKKFLRLRVDPAP